MSEQERPQDDGMLVPLRHRLPESLVTRYATNITVQHTDAEFIISFYEVVPPVLLGTPEENRAAIEELGAVEAICVARIAVPAARMVGFVKAIAENYENYMRRFVEPKE